MQINASKANSDKYAAAEYAINPELISSIVRKGVGSDGQSDSKVIITYEPNPRFTDTYEITEEEYERIMPDLEMSSWW
jgi:hypothetical protein